MKLAGAAGAALVCACACAVAIAAAAPTGAGFSVRAHDVKPAVAYFDGKATKLDTFYAHMAEPSLLEEGDRVRTGQVIGSVGQTGNATGCHLHFEIWTAPGWYEGGSPVDPLPALKQWDAYS